MIAEMRAFPVIAVVGVVTVIVLALADATTALANPRPDERTRVAQMLAAQPAIAQVRGRVVVRGDIARRRHRELVGLVGQVVADVERRFAGARSAASPRPQHPPISLVLLRDDRSFLSAASAFESVPSTMGFYRPDLRVALANVGNSVGNLRHELVHPLLGDDFPGIPAWLNEGIAALYGTARWERGGFRFLVNYRLRDLHHAMRAGTLPTLAQLAASTHHEVHGDRAGVYYALARYVLLYAETRGTLGALYAELKAARDVRTHRAVLAKYVDERAFHAWVKKLRY